MKPLMHLVTLLVAVCSLKADGIPTYDYFYLCGSGVVDCTDFSKHEYGDFGLAGAPVSLGIYGTAHFEPVASNILGEVIGNVSVPESALPAEPVAYGVNGTISCIPGAGFCDTDEDQSAVDINNSGLYLINGARGYSGIGFGGSLLSLDAFVSPALSPIIEGGEGQFVGINDSDQILLYTTEGEGVLSPTPLPEPSSLLFLGALACALGLGKIRYNEKRKARFDLK